MGGRRRRRATRYADRYNLYGRYGRWPYWLYSLHSACLLCSPRLLEQVESVQLYKNGGVGALNDMGTQEAAAH